ncbi:MAG: hypothetical protein LBI89_03320 [Prevotellaceae bacterium]|jgi:hypothetical protein|nr:hypothetical protein [Prevotellaceae bacterium]
MKQIKPVPYYTQCDTPDFKGLAAELRAVFLPQAERRFEMHHLAGFAHDAIIRYVAKWKKDYPCYLRADIAKYYPTLRAVKLVTQAQIAYRDLLHMNHVPKTFKDRFLPGLMQWARSLPPEQGIPLGSAMSAILAPVGLIPAWLAVKRRYGVKLIVFADDVLVLCRDPHMPREIWQFLAQRLFSDLGVTLNPDKTKAGRFAGSKVSFCGWSFAGGYARIAEEKYNDFKRRITEAVGYSRKDDTRSFIKRINTRIDGFGNYYKYGSVLRQFHELDCFVRVRVRGWLARGLQAKAHDNADLEKLGLHALLNCYHKVHTPKTAPQKQPVPPLEYYGHKPPKIDFGTINAIAKNTETICKHLTQVIALQRKLLSTITDLEINL